MDWIDYHRLLCFSAVVREESAARACDVLRLAQPTISSQIRSLQRALGEKLLVRQHQRRIANDRPRDGNPLLLAS